MTDASIVSSRATNDDRTFAVSLLQQALADGLIDENEYSDYIAEALTAKTIAALNAVLVVVCRCLPEKDMVLVTHQTKDDGTQEQVVVETANQVASSNKAEAKTSDVAETIDTPAETEQSATDAQPSDNQSLIKAAKKRKRGKILKTTAFFIGILAYCGGLGTFVMADNHGDKVRKEMYQSTQKATLNTVVKALNAEHAQHHDLDIAELAKRVQKQNPKLDFAIQAAPEEAKTGQPVVSPYGFDGFQVTLKDTPVVPLASDSDQWGTATVSLLGSEPMYKNHGELLENSDDE